MIEINGWTICVIGFIIFFIVMLVTTKDDDRFDHFKD